MLDIQYEAAQWQPSGLFQYWTLAILTYNMVNIWPQQADRTIKVYSLIHRIHGQDTVSDHTNFETVQQDACVCRSAPLCIALAKYVEEERVHIIVQRLVIQEQLAEQAQALTVNLVLLAVHLPAYSSTPVSAGHPKLTSRAA